MLSSVNTVECRHQLDSDGAAAWVEVGDVAIVDEAVMDVVGAGHDVAASAVAGVETWLR